MKKVPRVAVISDISDIGRCAVSVAMPILTVMGVQPCAVPTTLLSSHTGFRDPVIMPMDAYLEAAYNKYIENGDTFDAIYSGYFSNAEQIKLTCEYLKNVSGIKIVDSVLGDHGKRYSSIGEDMVAEMRKLAKQADIIIPNLTEASLLLEKNYSDGIAPDVAMDWLSEIYDEGCKSAIITSCNSSTSGTMAIAAMDNGNKEWLEFERIPAHYPGTGDVFASIVTASVLNGKSLFVAVERAALFLVDAIRMTNEAGTNPLEGILLERCIGRLMEEQWI